MSRLFEEALEIYNLALSKNRRQEPYRQLLDECGELLRGEDIRVGLLAPDADSPYDAVVVRFEDGRFQVTGKCANDDLHCAVRVDKLTDMTETPQLFIENPKKLDWSWILGRLREAVPGE